MTTTLRLVRGEIRKLTTTKLPWGFLAVLVVIAGLDAAVVAFGTDMDGSKAFVSTAADQQSLMAFAFNAMIGTSLFGAIAVAREYGHRTVVPMFLTSPNRTRAVLAQLVAVLLAGAVSGPCRPGAGGRRGRPGAAKHRLRLPGLHRWTSPGSSPPRHSPERSAPPSAPGSAALIRNIGGAVTTAVLVLFVIPPLAVQLFSDTASWIPPSLFAVISGVSPDVSLWAALLAIGAWALVPAAAGLVAVQRRDVV